ncbi:kinase-like protein [Macrolepiota fuliginosa MF-IS2]|uniref:Kinase-like protein n=1 Tax=Macrolepiota fuliginosa MF-IS2 TaxID=1400762 RepID=A0A9P5XHB9_9AGAR|nr:kinase-like protein [Macrolepiota fuliginosa MF-IS2]
MTVLPTYTPQFLWRFWLSHGLTQDITSSPSPRVHKYDVYNNELTELRQGPFIPRPIFEDINTDDLDSETIRIYEEATDEFLRLERASESIFADILHRTIWSDAEQHPRKVALNRLDVESIRKYLTFLRFRNSTGYSKTIASLRDAAEDKPYDGSVYPAYRPLFVRIRKRFVLRHFISFLKHSSADADAPHLRPENGACGVGTSLDDFGDIMELYCWRLCGAEVCLGVASEDQEYMLPDCVFGTLDEGFEEDPTCCDLFFPIFPTLSVYILGTADGCYPSNPTCTQPIQTTVWIDAGTESASDVHLRNAMILQTYPHYLYFSSLRTVSLSISSYDEFRWIQEHQDYSRLKQRCRQKFLQETVTKTLVLRPSVVLPDLTDQVKMVGNSAVAHGSFSDVWKGKWNDPVERRTRFVAVKFLRQIMVHNIREKLVKRLQSEVLAWHKLCHRHISQLFGIAQSTHSIGMVSPWYDNGTICEYVKRHPQANKLKLLIQVASGIAYLHNFRPVIIHGDLKGGNILVDDNGCAVISDFGLSKVMEETITKPDNKNGTSFFAGSTRWMAPELILALVEDDGCIPPITTHSDVYAYASVCLEVATGQLPYAHRSNDHSVTIDIMRGIKPTRGVSLAIHGMQLKCVESFWALLDRCWDDQGTLRPSMREILGLLESLIVA